MCEINNKKKTCEAVKLRGVRVVHHINKLAGLMLKGLGVPYPPAVPDVPLCQWVSVSFWLCV